MRKLLAYILKTVADILHRSCVNYLFTLSFVAFSLPQLTNFPCQLGIYRLTAIVQKHPSRGVLRKRYSENIQQIYRRTPIPKSTVEGMLLIV